MANHLKHETSPYLLQHAENPVDWYPWGEEAFRRARDEDKPVFLSIGYSTCHWCHVMAHESFEDPEIAALLNRHFISIKVDREERPDVDSIYMSVCQAFTGSGGWPTSIFLTPEQKPFFAGTYFPKHSRGGMMGLSRLLQLIREAWDGNREALLEQSDQIMAQLRQPDTPAGGTAGPDLLEAAAAAYRKSYDREHGGFGRAPKFPTPHNLLFLLAWAQRRDAADCRDMVEHTLVQMYRGGLFDHIGGGFCRYSTDARFLAPHFEKMLYDNALLILAYCRAWTTTQKDLYRQIARRTADYVLAELTAPEGGFYSAQDADSDGEEGKFYVFVPEEVVRVLGPAEGRRFCRHFDITERGNFEGKNIPNLLHSDPEDRSFDPALAPLREYRKRRCALHRDDKVLAAWNGLMIAALCELYRVSGEAAYLTAAQKAEEFLRKQMTEGDTLFVSWRAGKRGVPGFLDDYAAVLFAQLALYTATLEAPYLEQAKHLCDRVLDAFADPERGGFYLYERSAEQLILRPRETYDGAMPSGNGLMAWNLVRLAQLTGEARYEAEATRQLDFLSGEAYRYPMGHGMFLLALLDHTDPPTKVTVVPARPEERDAALASVPADVLVTLLPDPTEAYPLKDGKTTYYVCRGHHCLPPSNEPPSPN